MTEVTRHGFLTEAAAREAIGSDVVLLIGRVLMAAIYLNGGFHKLVGLDGFAANLVSHGVPVAAYPIAANDDAIRSVRLILLAVSQTITQSRAEFEAKRSRRPDDAAAAPAPTETVEAPVAA